MNRKEFLKLFPTLILGGCIMNKPFFVEYDKEGSRQISAGFQTLEKLVNYERIIPVPNIIFHLCDEDTINRGIPDNPNGAGKYATDGINHHIFSPVRKYKDKIVVERFILGHEVYNMLRWFDGKNNKNTIYNYYKNE